MKKNVDAIKLADMGLSLPTLCNRRYSITPEVKASTKLTIAETSETFCNTPFLLVMQIKFPVFSDRISFIILTHEKYTRLIVHIFVRIDRSGAAHC
jgi:hypothetical protein